jgi:hypothetical protein
MESRALSHLGRSPQSGWDVFSYWAPSMGALPETLAIPSEKYVCLLAWNAAHISGSELCKAVERLLDLGGVYFCCWGPGCERVHDAIDEVVVGDGTTNVARLEVMTTWHKEPIAETVDFFLDCACPADRYLDNCTTALAVVIGNNYDLASVELAIAVKLLQPPSDPSLQGARRRAARR